MLNEIRSLVTDIQFAETELKRLIRKNKMTGEGMIEQVFEITKNVLKFEPIFKKASMFGTRMEQREYFYRSDGELLKGVLIDSSLEYSGNVNGEETEEFNELFLTEDRKLKCFYTVHKYPDSRKHSMQHEVTRFEAHFDAEEIYYGSVIRSLSKMLKSRYQELMTRKELMLERLKDLDSVRIDVEEF
jgi:hypothetical protein